MPIANTCSIGYPHDGRADKAAYRHDRRADNAAYRHDRRADSLSHLVEAKLFVCFFVCVEALRPSQQFFRHVGTETTLPGFNQFCRDLTCLAQGHNTMTPVEIEPRTSRFRV